MELAKTYEDHLVARMQRDPRLMVLTAENRAVIRGMPAKVKERFIDFGITEQCMVGAAAGLAVRGRKPICHALTNFLVLRAFEFIRTDVGIAGLPVKFVGYVPGLLSDGNGPTHQALEDVSIMRGIPGMDVFCPADEEDLLIGLETILDSERPTYIRYNHRKPAWTHNREFHMGRAETVMNGNEIAILVYGTLSKEAYEAAQILKQEGRSVRLLNMRTVKPVDEAAIVAAAQECALMVTIEDHFLTGGLYTVVGEVLLKHRKTARVFPIAFDQRWYRPGTLARVLKHENLEGPQIAGQILRQWNERNS